MDIRNLTVFLAIIEILIMTNLKIGSISMKTVKNPNEKNSTHNQQLCTIL